MMNTKALYTLCFAKALSAALEVHIFPFIAAFISSLGVEDHDVASYASLAECMMALTSFLFTPLWVRLIECTPRRQLLVYFLTVSGVFAILFGLSNRVWHLIVLRALLGGCENLSLIANITAGNLADDQDKPQAFAWLGSANFTGVVIGLFLGGTLAESSINNINLLKRKPYLLPGLVLGSLAVLGVLAVLAFIPDTTEESAILNETRLEETPITYRELASNSAFRHIITMNFLNMMCFCGTLTLMSTAGHLPPDIGGIGFPVVALGRVMALTQLVTVFTLLVIFKRLFAVVSNRTIVIIGATGWFLLGIFFPIANLVSSAVQAQHVGRWVLWMTLGMWVLARPMGLLWWTTSQVLLNALYPHARERTKATGIMDQTSDLANVCGVLIAGQLFSFSSRHPAKSFARQLAFLFIICMAMASLAIATRQKQLTTKPNTAPESGETEPVLFVEDVRVDERSPLLRTEPAAQ